MGCLQGTEVTWQNIEEPNREGVKHQEYFKPMLQTKPPPLIGGAVNDGLFDQKRLTMKKCGPRISNLAKNNTN